MMKIITLLLLTLAVGLSVGIEDFNVVDGVDVLLQPAIVPEPVEGARWWYTPSRKAHIYRHRHPKAESLSKAEGKQGEDLRLPGDLVPVSYNVRLLPFIEVGNWTTDGFVEITFNCVRDTSNITINSVQLTIDAPSITVRSRGISEGLRNLHVACHRSLHYRQTHR